VSDNSDPDVPAFWVPEFFGDTVLVNGKVWPFLEVEPRKYRFRVLNASNARFYHLTLVEASAGGDRVRSDVPDFIQIGTDGGFLPAPVRLKGLTVAPAERFDVVIDFSDFDGKSFVLGNDAKAPFPDGDDVVPADVMLFKVTRRLRERDRSTVPLRLPAAAALDPDAASRVRDLILIENASAQDNPIEGLITSHWTDAVTETPRAGSTEIWRIINTTGDAHPIHVHLVQFNILDRQPFDLDKYPGTLEFTGPRVTPPANERRAAKDMVQAFPGEVTRIVARFDLPAGTRADRGQRFRYVLHCHILEHEDNDMMRPYDVVG
jgi:spore coat protein A